MIIKIDKEFKSLLQPLSKEEYEQLKQNLIADGCREPIVLWGEIIVDGHNRFEICTNNGIPYKTVQKDFPDRQSVMDWIDKNQLGRRNLTKEQISVVRGRVYNRKKKTASESGALKGKSSGQNVHSSEKSKPDTTATEIAHEFGVDERTIRRDGEFAEAIETLKPIADLDKDIKQKKKLSKTATVAAAKAMKEGDEDRAKEILAHGTKPQIKIAVPEDTDGKLKVIFQEAKIFDKWDKAILAIRKEVLDNYESNPAVACLYKPFFEQAIKRVREELSLARPTKICNECNGAGSGCEKCRGLGYLCERTEKNGN